jgi:alkylated DNA repair dioxygenase AlkB
MQLEMHLAQTHPDLPIAFYPDFLTPDVADDFLKRSQALEWQHNQIRMFGKYLPLPRLEAIYGDRGCDYVYSGSVELIAQPWTSWLTSIRQHIEACSSFGFDVVIGNRYPTGQHYIGWHADNQKSMGQSPAIASLSLGATRRFCIREKSKGSKIHNFELGHGSLLVMLPGCQTTHIHQLPKTNEAIGERINWTFRPHLNGHRFQEVAK